MRFPCIASLPKNISIGLGRRAVLACALSTTASVLLFSVSTAGQAKLNSTSQKASPKVDTRVARGRYIVENVARCGQCHTPRNAAGGPDAGHPLEGAAVYLKSAEPKEDWPLQAPRLAGTPPGTDSEMITLLTTGIWKDGRRLRDPMPSFRLTAEDAEAVLAYLKSLNPAAR
jgi:mono/diheme cytochrome c family protein